MSHIHSCLENIDFHRPTFLRRLHDRAIQWHEVWPTRIIVWRRALEGCAWYDDHPNPLAHRLIAKYIVTHIFAASHCQRAFVRS
jgi:hypothetical protein